jgi:hypothetical protein
MDPDTGATEPSPSKPQPPHDWLMWAAMGLAFVAGFLVAAATLPAFFPMSPPESPREIPGTATMTTAITAPTTLAGTVRPTLERTPVSGETPAVEETRAPTPTGTTPAQACVQAGPPGFTVTVSPVQANAAKGETVTYRMFIEAQNCFAEPIHMELVASVLFLSQTYDLGTQDPPYPKTFEYPFIVPDTLPPGVTVNGVIRSTGGGITRENQLSLTVQ